MYTRVIYTARRERRKKKNIYKLLYRVYQVSYSIYIFVANSFEQKKTKKLNNKIGAGGVVVEHAV